MKKKKKLKSISSLKKNGKQPSIEITCTQCKCVFLAHRKNRMFCSKKCRDKNRYTPKEKSGTYRKCSYCGESVYIRKHRNIRENVFCNMEHQVLFLKEKAHRETCVICGGTFFCQPCQVEYRNRKTCSMKCRSALHIRIAEQRNKENPPSKGALNRRIRSSLKMRAWRNGVFERDRYTCQICGTHGGYLQADHIKPFALYEELRFELSNGRTLCRDCHKGTDTFGRKPMYGKKKEANIIVS